MKTRNSDELAVGGLKNHQVCTWPSTLFQRLVTGQLRTKGRRHPKLHVPTVAYSGSTDGRINQLVSQARRVTFRPSFGKRRIDVVVVQ